MLSKRDLLRASALAALPSGVMSLRALAQSDRPGFFKSRDIAEAGFVYGLPIVNVQFCDGNTYNYGYVGTRTTGSVASDFLAAGPDWKGNAPPDVKQVFRSSTQFSLAVFRTQLFNPGDIANVARVQAGYKAVPLSTYLGRPAPAPAPTIDFPVIDKELARTNFFDYLDFALQFAPPQSTEVDIRAQLARIGIGPSRTFNFSDLSLKNKLEVSLGLRAGNEKVEEAVANAGVEMNGWRVADINGSSAGYRGDWLSRAVVAKSGVYANDTVEACYPFTRNDNDGQPLDGSQHAYTLTFPAGQLPPVNAFWSLTMYDGKTQLLIQNPINRYLINSPMLPSLKDNADGSLTIYIQSQSPGSENESNWLPAPSGPIYLMMRLYWPKTESSSILPIGKGTWKPPGVLRKF
jgi:hypothetical protein